MADDSERSWPSKNVSARGHGADVVVDAEALGGVGEGDGEERVGGRRVLRGGDVVGGALVGERGRTR